MLIIIVVVLLFATLVILHEAGHFIMARRNGVVAEEFGIGFPPKLFGRVWGGTLYSFNLLPLGGFVRLKGEDGADTGQGTFAAAGLWAQTKILLAGVLINFVTAFLILLVLCLTGLPGLGSLEPKFLEPSYAMPRQLLVAEVTAGSPAAQAGLKRGDYLLSANGQALTEDDQLRDFTKSHAGQSVLLDIRHGEERRSLSVTLRPPTEQQGYLGVATQPIYRLRYSLGQAVIAAGYITGALFAATVAGVVGLIVHLPQLLVGLGGKTVPDAAAQASGPVGIIVILQSISTLGWAYVWLFVANISVALAAFNVMPLPALDGGRLAVLVVSRITRRRFKPESEARYHLVGFVALLALMALITVYDIRKFF